jgi:hypothetical protein
MPTRIIRTLHAILEDGREVVQGQKVEMSGDDETRLEEQRALVPTEFSSFAEHSDHLQDAYRSGRGDLTAAGRLAEARSGAIVDLSASDADPNAYAEWLRTDSPTVDEVIAAVGDDPAKATAMLEAEKLATGGEPRAGVEKALTKISGE